jgi:hypothetical protein
MDSRLGSGAPSARPELQAQYDDNRAQAIDVIAVDTSRERRAVFDRTCLLAQRSGVAHRARQRETDSTDRQHEAAKRERERIARLEDFSSQ